MKKKNSLKKTSKNNMFSKSNNKYNNCINTTTLIKLANIINK